MTCVMIVENDLDLRCSIADALQLEGYDVVEAADYGEALRMLRQDTRPAAILLDLMMPGMGGWQFLGARRDDPQLADIPVIVASAWDRDDSVTADVYLTQPFSLEALLRAVSRCASLEIAPQPHR